MICPSVHGEKGFEHVEDGKRKQVGTRGVIGIPLHIGFVILRPDFGFMMYYVSCCQQHMMLYEAVCDNAFPQPT